MADYDNTNQGIVSKNGRKTDDKHPDITGTLNVDGVDYFLDGWKRERKDGSGGFYSLRVKRKDKQAGSQRQERTSYDDNGPASRDLDDEIPF